ncbi:MAG: helix-turn-helix domain-containing protein [Clostridioides sp.]|nr:helix-turn-helix domain-containing protein [Clostridioides sp.]
MKEVEISKNIRAFRKARRFTISELASRAGVTPSLLSQIEKGTANPSLNTLKKISYALEAPLFSFFINNEDNENLVVRNGNRNKLSSKSDDFSYELLLPDMKGSIEFILMKIPPVNNSAKEMKAHIGEEVCFVEKGSAVLHLRDSIIELGEGDSVKIPAKLEHRWENVTSEEVEVLFAVTPPCF